jgi:hypothetical protein
MGQHIEHVGSRARYNLDPLLTPDLSLVPPHSPLRCVSTSSLSCSHLVTNLFVLGFSVEVGSLLLSSSQQQSLLTLFQSGGRSRRPWCSTGNPPDAQKHQALIYFANSPCTLYISGLVLHTHSCFQYNILISYRVTLFFRRNPVHWIYKQAT